MKRNQIIGGVLALIVVGGGAFWGGMAYANAHPARSSFAGAGGTFARTAGAGGTFAGRTGAGGGITAGQIISTGSGTITIQAATGSSTQLVLVGGSTQILKSASGSMSDLTVGTNVAVTGTSNSDGSLTAQSIQIRPAGSPGGYGARGASSQTSSQAAQ